MSQKMKLRMDIGSPTRCGVPLIANAQRIFLGHKTKRTQLDVMRNQIERINGQRRGLECAAAGVEVAWQTYLDACREQDISPITHGEMVVTLRRCMAYSDFVAETIGRHPGVLNSLCRSGDVLREYGSQTWSQAAASAISGSQHEPALHSALRHFRRREMLRIAIRDLAGWAPLGETLRDLSALADSCVGTALHCLTRWQAQEWGLPHSETFNQPLGLVVLGMGKLGAHELNFSSDIDLIFAYREDGITRGARRSVTNEEFFNALGRKLIAALDATTEDGFVFRVDMRLRPNGESGPLVMSFDAMEEYYQSQGRDWERYAMIKARAIAGDVNDGRALLKMLRPFVYRRYLDFGAFSALREMKQLIADQVLRKGMANNIKLGPGGIREVEFIGQVFQLIRGGREPELQERAILPILTRLAAKNYLPPVVAEELRTAYIFLRHTENRIQAFADRQTQELPHDALERTRLALSMGFADFEQFSAVLTRHMATVHGHFQQTFVAPQSASETATNELTQLWLGTLDAERASALLRQCGFVHVDELIAKLGDLRDSGSSRALTATGRERLNTLVPMIMTAASTLPEPDAALLRTLKIIETIGRRAAYYALLVEYPRAVAQLVQLCAASSWIASYVSRHPLLLDELLDPSSLYAPLDQAALRAELADDMRALAADDTEQQMEVLRSFAHSNILRVAAADVSNAMPLMIVSDHLTDIAEVVLEAVLQQAWNDLVARHGVPRYMLGNASHAARFAIIGYGKLGGLELGYGSDLDVVFLHDSTGENERTDGARSLDNSVFFARLAQRIIHLLNTQTHSGVLYEVDVRLRPSGASGLLVSSLTRYADYQRTEAWTWEHQALVRARAVAGDPHIAEQFSAIRQEVLGRARDEATLKREVREMRTKMREELGGRNPSLFDIKQGEGGIADIEFMVQYLVLRWAHDHPELLRWPDNVRLLETSSNLGLLSKHNAEFLADAYRQLRAQVHRLSLQELPATCEPALFADIRSGVIAIWRQLLEDNP